MRNKVLLALACVTLSAAVVRLPGVFALLPHLQEPDAYMVTQATGLRDGTLEAGSIIATKYPQLMARLLAPILPPAPGAAQKTGSRRARPVVGGSTSLAGQLADASEPYVRARLLVAFLSVLLIPLTWVLVRRFTGPWGALFAAALVATSLLHIVNSQQARPHGPAASFILLALIALLAVRRSRRPHTLVLAGLACGLAVASLQNGLFVLPALGVTVLSRKRRGGPPVGRWLVVTALLVGAFALAFYPLDGKTTSGASSFFDVGGLQFGLRDWNGGGFSKLPTLFWSHDPILMVLAGLGLLRLLVAWRHGIDPDDRHDLLVLAAFAVPYAVIIGVYDKVQARYLLPLLPLAAGLAAAGAVTLVRLASKVFGSPGLARALVATVALGLPALASTRLAMLQGREDTLTAAARWLDEHVDPHETTLLISHDLCLPLRDAHPRRGSRIWETPWSRYQRSVSQTGGPAGAGELPWTMLSLLRVDKRGLQRPVSTARGLEMYLGTGARSGHLVLSASNEVRLARQLAPLMDRVTEVARFDALPPERRPDGSARLRRSAGSRGFQELRTLHRALRGVAWGPPVRIYRFDLRSPEQRFAEELSNQWLGLR